MGNYGHFILGDMTQFMLDVEINQASATFRQRIFAD